jgi:8-oxo-dGTP pyrophosphatase MutT (NUDIX family)
MSIPCTARIVATATDSDGVVWLVCIQDVTKIGLPGGTYLALPGGGAHPDEPAFRAAGRELLEETGLDVAHGLMQLKELGVINLRDKNRPAHDDVFFQIRFPVEYVRGVFKAIEEGTLITKEHGKIKPSLERVPLIPSEFLGSHYSKLNRVAKELNEQLFSWN